MKRIFKPIVFKATFLCLLLLSACGPAAEITASWTSPEASGNTYENILVAAMTEDVVSKQALEDQLAKELREKGINVTKSIELYPPNFREEQFSNREAMMQPIRENGFDAILTVAVVDEETETRYVPGAYFAPMAGFPYYGNFWGYFNHWGPIIYNPGYYTQDKVYFPETNLYDAGTGNLVWSAQSEAVDGGSLQNFSGDFAEVTTEALAENYLVNLGTASIK